MISQVWCLLNSNDRTGTCANQQHENINNYAYTNLIFCFSFVHV